MYWSSLSKEEFIYIKVWKIQNILKENALYLKLTLLTYIQNTYLDDTFWNQSVLSKIWQEIMIDL